jgi:Ca2+-binding EF-hand superfamily protein
MGGMCSKPVAKEMTLEERNERTVRGIFDRFDKDKSGFISKENLQQIIQDDKAFKNADVEHILSKFGDNGQMSFEQFKHWWNSTYTTYNDDNIKQILDELDAEGGPDSAVEPSPPRPLEEGNRRPSMGRLEESRS